MNDAQREAILNRKAEEAIMKRRYDIQRIARQLPKEEYSELKSLLAGMFIDGAKAAIETLQI